MVPSPSYYESHVTIEPVFGDRLDRFNSLARDCGFRVADLLLKKRAEDSAQRSAADSFATGRCIDYQTLVARTVDLVENLRTYGFKVWRYKIEAVVLDVRLDRLADPTVPIAESVCV